MFVTIDAYRKIIIPYYNNYLGSGITLTGKK